MGLAGPDDPEGARRESLAADFIDALAALHRFDWRATPLAKWGDGRDARERGPKADRRLGGALPPLGACARIRWRIARSRGCARNAPVARAPVARAWRLPARQFSRTRRADFRDSRLGARASRRSRSRISAGHSSRNIAAARRSSAASPAKRIFLPATKLTPDFRSIRASLRFYLVFSLLKLAFTHMAAARCFEEGLFNDMRMPAMATQIAPVFRQISRDAGAGRMNNSLPRLIDGMVATLRKEVIPRVDGDYARGQAFGVIYMLNSLKLRCFVVERLSRRAVEGARRREPRTAGARGGSSGRSPARRSRAGRVAGRRDARSDARRGRCAASANSSTGSPRNRARFPAEAAGARRKHRRRLSRPSGEIRNLHQRKADVRRNVRRRRKDLRRRPTC